MSRHVRSILTSLVILAITLGFIGVYPVQSSETQYAVGYVFHDKNRNGERDPGEEGIAGVMVSNGRAVVKTDQDGKYRLPVSDWTVIFITKPSGWMTPVGENNLPLFYYVHKPDGSPKLRFGGIEPTGPLPESVDFPLYLYDEPDKFEVIVFGDTQPYNLQEVFHVTHDTIPELIGVEAAFGVTLGDIVGNNLSLFEPLVKSMGQIGIPWYNVKGNHDADFDAQPDHHLTSATFTRVFGPPYYSYDYAQVHFIVLNNPYFGTAAGYGAELDTRQMSWLRRNLAMVPDDKLVVLMMHIPVYDMRDAQHIYRLIENRPNTLSLSAHRHIYDQRFITEKDGWNANSPHHHIIVATVGGAWYRGLPDDVGIPHGLMRDGTPKGYMIMTFDGNEYTARYKVSRRPDDYQMNIYAPNEVESANAHETEISVNVFACSEKSTVEMRLASDGEWIPMERLLMDDPNYVRQREFEAGLKPMTWKEMREPRTYMSHLWRANLPANPSIGAHLIDVRTTDMYGQSYTAHRVIHIR